MIYQCVDLYKHFGMERKSDERGFLTVYARPPHCEDPKNKLRPAMLVLPGGGYSFVSERENECVALEWLKRGYNSFVLNYSICTHSYPTQLLEAALAMLYIKQNAEQFATDVQHIAAIGFSAGGHLCSMLSNVSSNEEIVALLGEKAKDAQPNAVVLSYAVLNYVANKTHLGTFEIASDHGKIAIDKVDPIKRVSPNTAPTFLWHTREDTCVHFTNSVNYAMALGENGVSFELHIFEGADHGISLGTTETACNSFGLSQHCEKWVQLAADWLADIQGFGVKVKLDG